MASLEQRLSELELDVTEARKVAEGATRPMVVLLLQEVVRQLELKVKGVKEQQEVAQKKAKEQQEGKENLQAANNLPTSQLKDYSWDQSDKFVKVYLTSLQGLGGLGPENIKVKLLLLPLLIFPLLPLPSFSFLYFLFFYYRLFCSFLSCSFPSCSFPSC